MGNITEHSNLVLLDIKLIQAVGYIESLVSLVKDHSPVVYAPSCCTADLRSIPISESLTTSL